MRSLDMPLLSKKARFLSVDAFLTAGSSRKDFIVSSWSGALVSGTGSGEEPSSGGDEVAVFDLEGRAVCSGVDSCFSSGRDSAAFCHAGMAGLDFGSAMLTAAFSYCFSISQMTKL